MKLKLLVATCLAVLTLGSCGVDNSDKKADETSSAVLIESKSSEVKDSKLVTKGELLEVGQHTKDDVLGNVELIKIASPGNKIEVAQNVFVTFGNVKILHLTNIPESQQEEVSSWYGITGDEGYDLQFDYTVENNNDFKIENSVVSKLILSDGEQIERFMYANEQFDIEPKSKVSNQVGHVGIPHSEIDSVKFYIEPANTDGYESLGAQPVEITFN